MDSKQKRQIMSALYKALGLFVLLSVAWVAYFAINALVKQQGILWLNITLIAIDFFILMIFFINIEKVNKLKNFYSLAKFIFFITFLTLIAIACGVVVLQVFGYALGAEYYITIGALLAGELFSVLMFFGGLNLTKLFKNNTIVIDDLSEVPNYNDEIMLKKKLDELNRKLEMKKVTDEIEAKQKELGEN